MWSVVVATLVAVALLWYFREIVGYIIVSAVLAIIGAPLVRLIRPGTHPRTVRCRTGWPP